MASTAAPGTTAVRDGVLINALLAAIKLAAGIIGNTYALIADAVESGADILASLIVWGGLTIGAQPADDDHPFGHGKAEALAAATVSMMLLGAAVGIAYEAIKEIRTPHDWPAPWTLAIVIGVMVTKWFLSRRVARVGAEMNSTAVAADAAHHLSDAITSAAAFIGISIAVIARARGASQSWAAADDWAALFASFVIAFNGISMVRAALHDLMDRMPGEDVVMPMRRVAEAVPDVLAIEKLYVRRVGTGYRVIIHVQADPQMTLEYAHALGGRVKHAIRRSNPHVRDVLVHMEPCSK
ncbi:MAG TPA: cation diffusion facilitator family transporter [Gemmatimonadaceae bacterium]|jgi:cation diffusion facilitator family transporter